MRVAMRTLALPVAAVVFCCMTQPIHPQTDAGQSSSFQGKYIRIDKTSDFMTLGPDGVFTLFLGGKLNEGTYKIEGDTLSVTGPRINRHLKETQITGNTIRDPLGTLWVKQAQPAPVPAAAAPAVQETPPVPPAAAPAPAPMPEIAPPPPPSDVPPPTISIGQTIDQVTAGFGAPLKVARLGVKTIFYFKDMKVTFTDGKVSNVE